MDRTRKTYYGIYPCPHHLCVDCSVQSYFIELAKLIAAACAASKLCREFLLNGFVTIGVSCGNIKLFVAFNIFAA